MKEKFLRFIRANFIIWAFWAIALLIELTGVCVTSGKFLIRRPFILFSVLAIFTCILSQIRNQRGRYWCAFAVLMLLFLIDLVLIVVFDMTGSTFDYSMLKLRADAMAIVESVPINFVYSLVCGIAISLYMLLARYYMKTAPAPTRLLPRAATAAVMAGVLAFHGGMVYAENYKYNPADLSYKLYAGTDASYYDRGILGNLVDELYKGAFFSKVSLGNEQELTDFIYGSVNTPSSMFGEAEGYNVITVLAESFEWFSFVANADAYPGGHELSFPEEYTAEQKESALRDLYPNLYRLVDTSVVATNHHSREKTDISENHAIIGNYPTGCFINYDYPANTVPYSMPNLMKTLYGVDSYSFHNGEYTFYNRGEHHENALGFKQYTASEMMAAADTDGTFTNYNELQGEHNLDSEMIAACREQMFPANRRFNTFITSITMHGQFAYRQNLEPHYQTLIDNGIGEHYIDEDLPEDATLKERVDTASPFFHYAAAALEFDKAVGAILDYLENTISENTGKPLMDNTLLVLFGDHNAYYQSLGETVKNLYLSEDNGRNYTDLFRVPLIIRIGNTGHTERIRKFTTTTDIVPTILDLLGVRFYNNLNYGSTVFGPDESMIYSRAYNVFITDKLYFSSLNNIKYRHPDADDAYLESIKQKATMLLDKTSHVNRIFYYNFLSGARAEEYAQKLLALQKDA